MFDCMWLTMFSVGLLGAGHCVGMCGGIVAALGLAANQQVLAEPSSNPQVTGIKRFAQWQIILGYNLGRIVSYGAAGALVGWLGQLGSHYLGLAIPLRLIAAVMLILMGLYLANWWRGLTYLERLGGLLWRRIQPVSARVFKVQSPGKAVLFGMLWGWLPCGLVYSALAFAAALAHPLPSSLAMMAFGVGTLPAMLIGGVFSEQLTRWLQGKVLRTVMALILLAMGALMIFTLFSHGQHHSHQSGVGQQVKMDHNQHNP